MGHVCTPVYKAILAEAWTVWPTGGCAVLWCKWTLTKIDVRVNQNSSCIRKVLRAGMCNTSRAEFAPNRQFLKGKIYPVASLSFFCLASDHFLFTQKPRTSRRQLKPSLDNSFPDLIWSCIFSHTRLFCCCSVPLLLFLYTEVSSSFIVSHGTGHRCAEPLPLFIFILEPNSTYPYGKTSHFVLLLSCKRGSAGSWT